ncbi:MAG: dihydrolipoamide acetyltransferase, partial [Verrucomicrobiota bacterium]|nr:dihydrolipoamide acetyltransferase [Verrucomicrobiota bacterium]
MPEIKMPKLSDTMTEGTLVAWKKKQGDSVAAGEVIAEIETDKATMEWESSDDGVLSEIFVQEGNKVNVGEAIAFIQGKGEKAGTAKPAEKKEATAAAPQKPSGKKDAAPPAAEPEPASAPAKKSEPAQAAPATSGNRPKASPLARKIAAEKGI